MIFGRSLSILRRPKTPDMRLEVSRFFDASFKDAEIGKVEVSPDFVFHGVKSSYRVVFDRLDWGGISNIHLVVPKGRKHLHVLKMINTDAATLTQDKYADVRRSFFQEVLALSLISHPNVVKLLDFGIIDDGTPFYVMEFLPGRKLGEEIDLHFGLPFNRVVDIAIQICDGVSAAHKVKVVIRDLTSNNIILLSAIRGDFVKIIDFSFTHMFDPSISSHTPPKHSGNHEFVAPETFTGGYVGIYADIYSLGVILYDMIYCDRPDMNAKLSGRIVIPSETQDGIFVPFRLRQVLRKALELRPQDRFNSVDKMRIALENCQV